MVIVALPLYKRQRIGLVHSGSLSLEKGREGVRSIRNHGENIPVLPSQTSFAFTPSRRERLLDAIDQNGEGLPVAIRTMCARATVEDAWVLLILEYRLYTLRKPNSSARIRKIYNHLWESLYVQLLRLSETSKRSPAEVRTSTEILRAMLSSLILEANLQSRPAKALKER